MATSELTFADQAAAAPSLDSLGGQADRQTQARMRRAGSVPLVVSLGAQTVFYVSYWVPETSGVPGHRWWLTQLAPLTSTLLTSGGHAQVPAASGWWDLPALLLLVAGLAIYLLCRTPRFWLGPAGLAVPAVAGTLVALGEIISLAVSGQGARSWLSVLLLIAWVGTALYATVHKIFDDPTGQVAPTLKQSLIPLAVYAVIGPAPTAVGRMLFGRPLRGAALALQENTLAGRLAALVTPATLLLYLCGLLIGVALWVAWAWWPPRRRLPAYAGALVLLLGGTMAIGVPTTSMATDRADVLRNDSPVHSVHFSCGALSLDDGRGDQAPRPTRTLVVTGFTCKTVTTFVGYRQQPSQSMSSSLSPLSAQTPEGVAITSRLVGAQYATALIVAAGSRIDKAPDRLIWLDPNDGHPLGGEFRCGDDRSRPLTVRFAQVPDGDDPALGHLTLKEKRPTVVVDCEGKTYRFDPAITPR